MACYERFDRSELEVRDLGERGHDLLLSGVLPLAAPQEPYAHPDLSPLRERIHAARAQGRPVVLMLGGHPIKLGLSRFLIDLVDRGMVTHLAANGSFIIHDFELALAGGTSEDVARWIRRGQFGLWRQTALLNEVIREAAGRDEGLGEAAGRAVEEMRFSYRHLSVVAACWRRQVPCTCHVGVGSDIIHALPNCDGAALGRTSYTDFLVFARTVQDLEGGVFLNVGSAVTGPEVYLKALSMARNVARQRGEEIRHFTTAVFDLVPLPDNWRDGPPTKDHPLYYYRPWKTILCRTVADGGTSFYFCGDHRQTIPTLWHHLVSASPAPESNSG